MKTGASRLSSFGVGFVALKPPTSDRASSSSPLSILGSSLSEPSLESLFLGANSVPSFSTRSFALPLEFSMPTGL